MISFRLIQAGSQNWHPLASTGILTPIDSDIYKEVLGDLSANLIYETSYQDKLFALPLQPHAEILFFRSDELNALNLEAPGSLAELLELAQTLQAKSDLPHAICFNGQRGSAFGQTIMHIYGALADNRTLTNGHWTLEKDDLRKTLLYLAELKKYAPTSILEMAWDERIASFENGECAMTFGWTARAGALEEAWRNGPQNVGYAIPFVTKDQKTTLPFGMWSLTTAKTLSDGRKDNVQTVLKHLVSPAGIKNLIFEGGMSASPYALDIVYNTGHSHFKVLDFITPYILASDLRQNPRNFGDKFQSYSDILGNLGHDYLAGTTGLNETVEKIMQEIVKQSP